MIHLLKSLHNRYYLSREYALETDASNYYKLHLKSNKGFSLRKCNLAKYEGNHYIIRVF